MLKIWINGKLVDEKDANVSVFDRGFLYGDSVFETMRCAGGKISGLDEHLQRLLLGLKALGIRPPYPKNRFISAIRATLKANCLKDAYIRVAVTRGEGTFGIARKDDLKPNVVIVAKPYYGYPESLYRRGISARTVGSYINERSVLSRTKSGNFLPYILARQDAQSKGFDEAILLNTRGCVAEAATSNVFLVMGGSLVTPSLDSGILPGITRAQVIKLARKSGFKVIERRVMRRELYSAGEIFLTNSLSGLIPVTRVDRRKIGPGLPGPITKLLFSNYRLLTV